MKYYGRIFDVTDRIDTYGKGFSEIWFVGCPSTFQCYATMIHNTMIVEITLLVADHKMYKVS